MLKKVNFCRLVGIMGVLHSVLFFSCEKNYEPILAVPVTSPDPQIPPFSPAIAFELYLYENFELNKEIYVMTELLQI